MIALIAFLMLTSSWAARAGAAEPQPADAAADAVRARVIAAARAESPRPAPPAGAAGRAALDGWLERNRESVENVRRGPLNELPWGVSTYRPAAGDGLPPRLYLHVFTWHAGGKLVVYGLTGGVKRASLLSNDRQDLPISSVGRFVAVAVPKEPPDVIDTVVVLELDGEPRVVPLAVQPEEEGKIVLHARDAIIHGRTLRYEPEPHKNTVGYWTDASDRASWRFDVKRPGKYAVEILQGCGKGSGGSDVEFRAAGQVLPVTVRDTGHFQNFVARNIGHFAFDRPGTYTLEVRPVRKPGVAVMDLRRVTLTPAGGDR